MLKLKPIIASMMLLGLAAPAFADDMSAANAATQSQLDSMKAQLAKMEAIINQNNNGGFYQPNDWTSRITLSGLANVDAVAANRTPVFGAKLPGNSNVSNIDVNNANLLVDALVNDWTKLHIGLLYSANTTNIFQNVAAGAGPGGGFGTAATGGRPTFDEGYITIENFAESAFFIRGGREYVPFGDYDRYPMIMNPTQLLSETQATAAEGGFVSPIGIYGSLYAFRGVPRAGDVTASGYPTTNRTTINNWGADLGYNYSDSSYGLKVDLGYLNNMDDTVYASQDLTVGTIGYLKTTHGLAASIDGSAWNFDLALRYAGVVGNTFSSTNVNKTVAGVAGTNGASPRAWGAELGYNFPVIAHQTRFAIGYQGTRSAPSLASTVVIPGLTIPSALGGFGLPKTRYYGDYVVNISKWTDVGVAVYHDNDYSTGNAGTGNNATVGMLRLGVKFA